jgi:predicted Holliday junction resolvase-like endonuclease
MQTHMDVLLIVLLLLAAAALVGLFYRYASLKAELESRAREQDERYTALKAQIETRARAQYEVWRESDLVAIKKQYEELTRKEAGVQFQQWRQESQVVIRKDAVEKSRAVILGKVTEHVVPFFPAFHHNPKDARFIGTPVDFIVFDGLDDREVRNIVFVEVKTGSSSLNTRERQIRNAVKQGLVEWEELRIPVAFSQNHLARGEALPEVSPGKSCSHCGKGNRDQAQFCGYCGKPL